MTGGGRVNLPLLAGGVTLLYVRACLHGGGGPQVGEVTRLGEAKK